MRWPTGLDVTFTHHEDGTVAYSGFPPFVDIAARATPAARQFIRSGGYRKLEHDWMRDVDTYCRPLLGWLVLRGVLAVHNGWWGLLWRMWRLRLIHSAAPLGTETRMRDIRPGPKRGTPGGDE